MNALNRLVMIVIALLLIAFPVLFLLINWGVLQADLIDQYTNYRAGLDAAGVVTDLDLSATRARIVVAIIGALVGLIALIILLRELTLGKVISRNAVIDESPGAETRLTSRAIRSLAEGAARESGAASPSASLTSRGKRYVVECQMSVPEGGNYTEIASRARENIRTVLSSQSVQVKDVQVTVRRREV